ncbi:Integral membrane protein [Pseudomonas chlororaphis]|uniref:sulfite exporter TauE/SafE family protein n=1 Tax=Pseudomonas chlororaphis TaxID=587753 RepID=UPI000F715F34|nr:Integral membrane protein [Pseudomonas chlororaphis]
MLFAFGGGFVGVPLLYRMLLSSHGADDGVAQSAMHIAVATSTCVMIVNALMATGKHRRAGNLIRHYLWPLGGYIGLGAIAGAVLAMAVSGEAMRYAFIAYLALTIADCLMRRGFLEQGDTRAPRCLRRLEITGGLGIGAMAFAVQTLGSLLGMRLASPWIGRIPDRRHARVYIGLLVLVR